MGKAARVARRQKAAAARTVITGDRLKIVAVTYPAVNQAPGGGPDLSADLRLVRSAILYADEVVLLSPTAAALAGVSAVGATGAGGLLSLVNSLDDRTLSSLSTQTGHEPDVAKFRADLQLAAEVQAMPRGDRRRLPAEVRRRLRELVDAPLDSATAEYQAAVRNMNHSAGADELQIAIDRGVLTIDATPLIGSENTDAMTTAFVAEIKALLEDPSAHLLFDEQVTGLASAMVKEGHVEPHRLALTHALRAGTGSGFVERLPAFPDSSLELVLAARADLQSPLMCYRQAVTRFASRIPPEAVLDSTLKIELDDLWRDELVPTLDHLRRDLADHKLAHSLVRGALTNPKDITAALVSAGALVFGVNTVGVSTAVAGAVGTVAGLAQIATTSAVQAHAGQAALRKNDLYYLLEVGDRLAE